MVPGCDAARTRSCASGGSSTRRLVRKPDAGNRTGRVCRLRLRCRMAARPTDPDASAPTVAAGPAERVTTPRKVSDTSRGGLDPRYAVGDVIGRGGMGEVRLAHDERVGREVAIKRLRTEGAPPPEAVSRFLREARV